MGAETAKISSVNQTGQANPPSNPSMSQADFKALMNQAGVHEFTGTVEMQGGKRLWLSMVRASIGDVRIEMVGTHSMRSSLGLEEIVDPAARPQDVKAFHLAIFGKNIGFGGLCYEGADINFAREMVAKLAAAATDGSLIVPMGSEHGERRKPNLEVVNAAQPNDKVESAYVYRGDYRPV